MKSKGWLIRFGLLLGGTLMIVFGVLRGEHLTVLEKAVKICLECMGIG